MVLRSSSSLLDVLKSDKGLALGKLQEIASVPHICTKQIFKKKKKHTPTC